VYVEQQMKDPDAAGRKRAQRAYPQRPCQECGTTEKRIDRHHVNGDTLDNSPENVALLCSTCHTKRHWAEGSQSQRVAAQRERVSRIRHAVLADYQLGMPVAQLMQKHGIGTSTLYQIVKPARM
jgi:hypothetical protein